jgi:hypothetical protein
MRQLTVMSPLELDCKARYHTVNLTITVRGVSADLQEEMIYISLPPRWKRSWTSLVLVEGAHPKVDLQGLPMDIEAPVVILALP